MVPDFADTCSSAGAALGSTAINPSILLIAINVIEGLPDLSVGGAQPAPNILNAIRKRVSREAQSIKESNWLLRIPRKQC
jgi:hypothetical protein